jgi:hypothetical protein
MSTEKTNRGRCLRINQAAAYRTLSLDLDPKLFETTVPEGYKEMEILKKEK